MGIFPFCSFLEGQNDLAPVWSRSEGNMFRLTSSACAEEFLELQSFLCVCVVSKVGGKRLDGMTMFREQGDILKMARAPLSNPPTPLCGAGLPVRSPCRAGSTTRRALGALSAPRAGAAVLSSELRPRDWAAELWGGSRVV